MKKYIAGAVLSIGLVVSPAFTHASGLTSVQVQAILGLLTSFGADSATIANVNAALTGGTPNTAPPATTGAASFCSTFNKNDVATVRKFQASYGISQTGTVGPITRAKIKAVYGCNIY